MEGNKADFRVEHGGPTYVTITDPEDKKTRRYLMTTTLIDVVRVGENSGEPTYAVNAAVNYLLIPDQH